MDVNRLNIFHYVPKPLQINLEDVNSEGGGLRSGVYYIAAAYIDDDGTRTNYVAVSPPISITNSSQEDTLFSYDGAPAETPTGKSINITLSNVDNHYNFIQLAVIPQYQGSFGTVEILPKISTHDRGDLISYIYTGFENHTEGSLDEILINRGYASTAKSIAQLDNSLYLGNITRKDDIGYQKYANNIKVKLAEKDLYTEPTIPQQGIKNTYNNAEVSFNLKSYRRDEVYAFYISFLLKDGSETFAYHIPGRPANEDELLIDDDGEKSIIAGSSEVRNFHFNSIPDSETGMGYWENRNEFYPFNKDWEIWNVDSNGEGYDTGDYLIGKRVRHHRFPNIQDKPHFTGRSSKVEFETDEALQLQATTTHVLGIKLENIKIPNDIINDVVSLRVHYARRTEGNKRILDDSLYFRNEEVDENSDDFANHLYVSTEIPTGQEDQKFSNENISLYPFHLLRTKKPIGSFDYIDVVKEIEPSSVETRFQVVDLGLINVSVARFYLSRFFYNYNNVSRQICGVNAKSYVPYNTMEVEVEGLGFDKKINNFSGKSHVAAKLNTPLEHYTSEGEVPKRYYCHMCSFKWDLYRSFDNQELIWTGFQDDNLEKYNNGNGNETPNIFGGDTFISNYSHFVTQGLPAPDTINPLINVHYMCQSDDNIAYRHVGEEREEAYFPNVKGEFTNDFDKFYKSLYVFSSDLKLVYDPILTEEDKGEGYLEKTYRLDNDNYFGYNEDYSSQARIKPAFPYPKSYRQVNNLPTRVMRSQEDITDTVIDNFRIFLAEDYLDLPLHRGEINKLVNLNNVLGVHMTQSLYRTRGREQLSTGDFTAFLGSGDIFEVKPDEMFNTSKGYGGLQSLTSGYSSQQGYLFVDQQARRIYLVSEGINDISSTGLNSWFYDNLSFELEKYNFDINRPHKPNMYISVSYDQKYRRFFITKRELYPKQNFIDAWDDDIVKYDEESNSYYSTENGDVNYIDFEENVYFTDNSWTISYIPEMNMWESFHDFHPDEMIDTRESFLSVKGQDVYKHNDSENMGNFYGENFPMIYEVVDNREPHVSKRASSIVINTVVKDQNEKEIIKETVDKFRIYNDYQDSGEIEVVYLENARRTKREWNFNKFRDILDDDGELKYDLPYYKKRKFNSNYHVVKFIYDNENNNKLYILGARVNSKPAIR